MIDLLFSCEYSGDHPHGCENSDLVQIDDSAIRLDEHHAVLDAINVPLPEGWTTSPERGAARLRCPEHSDATERLR